MSVDKCPVCDSNLRQYGWTVVCEEECGFQCDVSDLDKIIEKTNKLISSGFEDETGRY